MRTSTLQEGQPSSTNKYNRIKKNKQCFKYFQVGVQQWEKKKKNQFDTHDSQAV